MNVVICVPWDGGQCEYRNASWKIVRQYLETHHPDFPIYIGENHDDPFNIARARNDAAKQAGNWDVAIFADADTLVHPNDLVEAIEAAVSQNKMTIAGDGKIYADQRSSQQYIDTGMFFPAPTDWPDTRHQPGLYDPKSVYRNPCSGYVVMPHDVWVATGGYLHNADAKDSYEDLVMFACAEIFGGGMLRTPGLQIHIWHPVAPRYKGVNHRLYQQLARIRHRPNAKNSARQLLAPFGHEPPR